MSDHVVLLPVKPPARGKSRLDLPAPQRSVLARAFALDTIEACLAAPVAAVLVVSDDALFAAEAVQLGGAAIPDGVSGDLNASLRLACAEVARRWPGLRPVALCADMPVLHPEDLALALTGLPQGPAYVADEAGTGTTLYTAAYADFSPCFGLGSARRHAEAGATAIEARPSLRRDVDTLDDLRGAQPLGWRPRTAQAIRQLGLF